MLEHFRLSLFVKFREIAPVLGELAGEFGTHVYHIPIASFVETLPLLGMKKLYVSEVKG
jgi:hypothetical protein